MSDFFSGQAQRKSEATQSQKVQSPSVNELFKSVIEARDAHSFDRASLEQARREVEKLRMPVKTLNHHRRDNPENQEAERCLSDLLDMMEGVLTPVQHASAEQSETASDHKTSFGV